MSNTTESPPVTKPPLRNSYAQANREEVGYCYYHERHGLTLKTLIDEMITTQKDYRVYCHTTKLSLSTLKCYLQQSYFWLIDNLIGDENAKPYVLWRRNVQYRMVKKSPTPHVHIHWKSLFLPGTDIKRMWGIIDLPGREAVHLSEGDNLGPRRTGGQKPDNSWHSEIEEYVMGEEKEYKKTGLQLTDEDILSVKELLGSSGESFQIYINKTDIRLSRV